MSFDYQLGELVNHSLLNLRVDRQGHRRRCAILFAVWFFPRRIRMDYQLLVAKRTSDTLLALTDPSSLGPLDFVDLVGLGCPFRQFLKGS